MDEEEVEEGLPPPRPRSGRSKRSQRGDGGSDSDSEDDERNRPQAIEICVACRNLPENADFGSPCDPCVIMFYKEATLVNNEWNFSDWLEYARTETITDTVNPRFCQYFTLTYSPKVPQPVKFCVYDWEGAGHSDTNLSHHTPLGQHETYLATIMNTQGKRVRAELDEPRETDVSVASSRLGQRFKDFSVSSAGRKGGFRAHNDEEETSATKPRSAMVRRLRDARRRAARWDTQGNLPHIELAANLTNDSNHLPSNWARLELSCEVSKTLQRKGGPKTVTGKPDCFIEVLRDSDGVFDLVYRSETCFESRKPKWRPFAISLARLCMKDVNKSVRMVVYDWRPGGAHLPLGIWQGPVRHLQHIAESQGSVRLEPAQRTSQSSSKGDHMSLSRAVTRSDRNAEVGNIIVLQCRTFAHRNISKEQAMSGGAIRPEEMTLSQDKKFLISLTRDQVCRRQPTLTQAVQECLWGMHEADQLTNTEVEREGPLSPEPSKASSREGGGRSRGGRRDGDDDDDHWPELVTGAPSATPTLNTKRRKEKRVRASKRLGGCWIKRPDRIERLDNGEPSRERELQRLLRPTAPGYVDVTEMARQMAIKNRASSRLWAYNLMQRSLNPTKGWKVNIGNESPTRASTAPPRMGRRATSSAMGTPGSTHRGGGLDGGVSMPGGLGIGREGGALRFDGRDGDRPLSAMG